MPSEHFQKRKLEAYLIKNDAGIVYACFAPRSPAPIHRLSLGADGIVRHEWAYGMWADAKSLSYVPLETILEVQE